MTKFIRRAINPIKFFISDSRFTGVLLLCCTAVSLILSNSSNGEAYRGLLNSELHYGIPFQ
ncbi:MAG: hypothetical protein ACRDE5_12865, partial [Ginsengibacter sp.]